jgi:hypothetical protein
MFFQKNKIRKNESDLHVTSTNFFFDKKILLDISEQMNKEDYNEFLFLMKTLNNVSLSYIIKKFINNRCVQKKKPFKFYLFLNYNFIKKLNIC